MHQSLSKDILQWISNSKGRSNYLKVNKKGKTHMPNQRMFSEDLENQLMPKFPEDPKQQSHPVEWTGRV